MRKLRFRVLHWLSKGHLICYNITRMRTQLSDIKAKCLGFLWINISKTCLISCIFTSLYGHFLCQVLSDKESGKHNLSECWHDWSLWSEASGTFLWSPFPFCENEITSRDFFEKVGKRFLNFALIHHCYTIGFGKIPLHPDFHEP